MSLFINNGRKSSALLTAILILIILTLFNACKRDVMNIYWKNLNILERNIRFDNPADLSSARNEYQSSSFFFKSTPSIQCRCEVSEWKEKSKDFNLNEMAYDVIPENNLTIKDLIDKRHPNIRSQLLDDSQPRCSLIPFFTGLNWDGVWQVAVDTLNHPGTEFQIFSAGCDNHFGLCDVIRILVLSNHEEPRTPFCYLWRNISSDPIIVKASNLTYLGEKNESREYPKSPFMVECVPEQPIFVTAVSLSFDECNNVTNYIEISRGEDQRAQNLPAFEGQLDLEQLRRQQLLKKQKDEDNYEVAICLPALYYYTQDLSLQMIEWFEILKKLKASKVLAYVYNIHPNMMKVLNYYEREGMASVTYFTNPTPFVNSPELRSFWFSNKLHQFWRIGRIHFSDCLLRNKHEYNFIYHIDLDELPILLKHHSLPDFLRDQTKKFQGEKKLIHLRWNHFPVDLHPGLFSTDIPDMFFKLRHNIYSKSCPSNKRNCHNVKTVYDTRHSFASLSHTSFWCHNGPCQHEHVSTDVAFTGHWRHECSDSDEFCRLDYLAENVSFNWFRKDVMVLVKSIAEELNLIPRSPDLR